MNEDVLATTILRYETEPFLDVVLFDRTETFLGRSCTSPLRRGTRGRAPFSPAGHLSSACVHIDDLGDLRALRPLADPDFQASPVWHAAMARSL